ncbi:DUF1997 domain-containing protein [Kovacikia minuta CCNUW1]|uniref:DUF1997 domain-containing protein n=1 Tax=Kovacikia minuta TaxID=2931930 RepID=UPI001CC979FB|nr:DUF1997 domain-containing protein [Kovacikia minuta]UBF24219.1 DUF1997 domain-containing protein [Kovacikia minuta CCNUW1]
MVTMQFNPAEPTATEVSEGLLHTASVISNPNTSMPEELPHSGIEPTKFYSHFVDSMEMHADVETVAKYFDDHHAWFTRCAHPMMVEPLGKNGYALIIGRFGSFGYEVEPRIGLDLLPQNQGVYRIETIPIPDYETTGYEVDFRAAMELVELVAHEPTEQLLQDGKPPEKTTRVQWDLNLTVIIQFPRFINALPKALIQSTGDRVLRQIVRQVSHRLTRKVLEDFHTTYNVPIPKHSRRWFFHKHEGE